MNNIEAVYYTEIQPEIITLKSDKRYYVQGYISTTDIDLANEVLTENAQRDLHNQIQTIIKSGGFITGDVEHMIFYDDNGKALSMPKVRDASGSLIIPEMKIIDSELRDKGVWVKAEINRNHPNFNTIWKNIEEGFLNGFSVAVKAITTITKKINNEWVNLIDKIKLINVTMTGTPANPNALMRPVLKSLLGENMLLKHKYIKREGSPGNYKYIYNENPQDKKEYSGTKMSDVNKERNAGVKIVLDEAHSQQLNIIYDLSGVDQSIIANRVGKSTKDLNPSKDRSAILYAIDDAIKEVYDINSKDGNVSEDLQEYAESKGWIEKSKVKDSEGKKLRINDKVTIHPDLTKDPKNKQGKSGILSKVIDLDTIEVTFEDGSKGKYEPDAIIKKSINTNLKTKGDLMEYDKLTDEQKKEYDALENDEDKKAFLKKCGESDSVKKSLENQDENKDDVEDDKEDKKEDEQKEDVPELKSALTTLKSEITTLKSNLEQLNTYNSELKTELKAVAERLEKIESQPIKKSLVADKSKMLGSFDNVKLKEYNAIDLI